MSTYSYDEERSPRHAYPRPTFVRRQWLNLNGVWSLEFDDDGRGMQEKWRRRGNYSERIYVPFPFESPLSGIGDKSVHPRVWYSRRFDLGKEFRGSRCLLHLGAVDYTARVWVNGKAAGNHRGGYTPFSIDITHLLKKRENLLVVYAEDLPGGEQCRGRQAMTPRPDEWSYERTTGIWQTAWLEPVPDEHLLACNTVSTSTDGHIEFEAQIAAPRPETEFTMRVYLRGMEVASFSAPSAEILRFAVNLPEVEVWSPEEPVLYATELLLLREGQCVDKVRSYFGVRSIEVRGDRILLNGKPYYLRMVSDQRYYPDGHYVAPHDAMLKRDVELAKKMGFNSVRTVHKTPEPRFLYWCDKLGLLVWQGMPGFREYSKSAGKQYLKEWLEVFARDRNHPSIATWVMFEKGFGLDRPQQNGQPALSLRDSPEIQKFVRDTVGLVRAVDPTRLVVDNSGCHHVDTDIADIHEQPCTPKTLEKNVRTCWLGDPDDWDEGRELMAAGHDYGGQPVVLSDYGDVTCPCDDKTSKSKNRIGCDPDHLSVTYENLAETVAGINKVCGRCYRQLTDVCGQHTGLLEADRKPKTDCEHMAEINRRHPASE